MNKLIQNMKMGFDNIKELIGIFINDESNDQDYNIYLNSENSELAKTAMLLQSLEHEQEEKRFSLFKPKVPKNQKKNYNPIETPSITELSKTIPNDIQQKKNGLEPDK